MLRVNQIKLRPGHTEEELIDRLCAALSIKREALQDYRIHKQSIDARKKPDVFLSYVIDAKVRNEAQAQKRNGKKISRICDRRYRLPGAGNLRLPFRPVIIGSGPAGLFCAYILAKGGYAPILLEQGAPVEERVLDVKDFWKTGNLKLSSNVQFGEGGAGTFSDGKLNTLVKDTEGRNRFVLETFVTLGAPKSILYEQKPHIGTDILIEVVKNMRKSIENLGGQVRFNSQVTDILVEDDFQGVQRKLKELVINGQEYLETETAVLAIGHSARDTFSMLLKKKVTMEAKAFAVGVRIEHPQSMITKCQYGRDFFPGLPAASYKLSEQLPNKRGVYTFCMCPGGYVVDASSEKGCLAVNGMSYHKRDGKNANSAIIVTVHPDDYGSGDPLSGVTFQRMLEVRAYEIGAGKVPVQRFADFVANEKGSLPNTFIPQIKGAYRTANVRSIFPEILGESLVQGIGAMGKKIPGFAGGDALISGVESRTSSPIKIQRDENMESNISGLYPCGEGAGYAGGITSAAMDGMRVAESIIKKFRGV